MELSRLGIVALLLATMGCTMGQTTNRVSWDLSHGHARSAVGWQGGGPGYAVPDADATILLPGRRTLRAQGVDLNLTAQGDQVEIVAVMYPKTTVDSGVAQARRIAKDWNLRTDLLESWYQEVLAGRQRGRKDSDESFNVGMAGAPLAPGGPTLYARVIHSFDPELPFRLDLELQWV
jgi:hypothetical protein